MLQSILIKDYRYNRLPFGIASAPSIFQKTLDTILHGIPLGIYYIDDILVTGANDEDHFQNLAEVSGIFNFMVSE